jgi:general secretion pathway protein B
MSILLEALRKSEKSQRPVEVPTIHQDDPVLQETTAISRGPLMLLLVVAAIAIGWLVLRQYQPAEDGYQPPVALPSKSAAQSATPVDAQRTPDTVNVDPTGSKVSSGGQRTPVESYKQPVRIATAPIAPRLEDTAAMQASQTQNGQKQTSSKPVRPSSQQVSASGEATKPATRPKTVLKRESKASQVQETQNDKQVAKADTEFKPQEPAPISYWELPDSIRADIPEIKFSVLVYANEPADRFVLSNGQRLKEGDSYQQGLVVEEIRREGVVFSYRLYRFLVER